jgi:hypothetical protein|tara:strand:+ start:776 stop:2899 length:2124 start_codon:yes stop_codon:yes gene_type:complete
VFNLNITAKDSSLDLALAYAETGLSVIPLQRHNKVPPRELGSWEKYKTEQPTTEQIERWFKGRNDLVVALVCGKFIVVDADTPESVNWAENNLPVTPFKVATGKGMHYYYNNPENFTTYVARRTDSTDPAKLIDLRGVGGLIIAPHNIHATGAIYEPIVIHDWGLDDFDDLPDFTKELWVKITGAEKLNGKPISAPLSIQGVREGSRNDQAARLAGYLIAKDINIDFVEFFVQSWNRQNNPPLNSTEVSTTVNSIQKTHDRKNQQAPAYIKTKHSINEPIDLYNPPGVLKDIYDYSENIAKISQPAISMQAALSVGSVAAGRMYRTDMNNFSSLFFMCIAKSGQGKENVKTVVESILDRADHSDLMAGDGYTSSGAIYSLLRYKPTHITVMDEFGKRLESISKSSNSNKEDALQVLMETWGRCHGVLRPDNYSMMTLNQKQQKEALDRSTIKPAITLVGMSVPKNFYGALSTGRIVDGFLNRFIVVESHVPRSVGKMIPYIEPPKYISDWVTDVRQTNNEMEQIARDNAELDFKQRVLTFDDDSRNLLERLAYDLVDQQNGLEKEGLEVLLSRTREKAMRLALIGALADNKRTKTITGDITKWAIDYVYYYDQLLIDSCKDKVAGSETEGRIKQVLSFIRSQGEWGISKREVDRNELFRSMKSYEVKEIIERLKNSGEIQEKDVKKSNTGRPTKRIVAIDPEFFNED